MSSDSYKDFLCVCTPESKQDAEALFDDVVRYFKKISKDSIDIPWLTWIVQDLNWEYKAYINSIHNDMWSGVSAKKYSEEEPFSTWIECDIVEQGIAATWLAFAVHDKIPALCQILHGYVC